MLTRIIDYGARVHYIDLNQIVTIETHSIDRPTSSINFRATPDKRQIIMKGTPDEVAKELRLPVDTGEF